jgi:hypothetical protein
MKRLTQSSSDSHERQSLEGARQLFESSMRDSIVEREKSSADVRRILRKMEVERAKIFKLGENARKLRETRSTVKADIYQIGNFLRRNGYQNVNMIAFAKVPVIKLRDPRHGLDIDLIIDKKIATHNSVLVREYLQCDSSGKIKKAAIILKHLVKVHGLGDASTGALSSYSWVMLLLHTLLHHEYLPPLQRVPRDSESAVFCENYFVGFTVKSALPCYYESRLAKVTVAELLILFTGYITSRVDVAEKCLTLRGRGEVMPKSFWLKGGVQSASWCLSIEASINGDSRHCESRWTNSLHEPFQSLHLHCAPLTPFRCINPPLLPSVPPPGRLRESRQCTRT